jgi:hypothetical protein
MPAHTDIDWSDPDWKNMSLLRTHLALAIPFFGAGLVLGGHFCRLVFLAALIGLALRISRHLFSPYGAALIVAISTFILPVVILSSGNGPFAVVAGCFLQYMGVMFALAWTTQGNQEGMDS